MYSVHKINNKYKVSYKNLINNEPIYVQIVPISAAWSHSLLRISVLAGR